MSRLRLGVVPKNTVSIANALSTLPQVGFITWQIFTFAHIPFIARFCDFSRFYFLKKNKKLLKNDM